MQLLSSPAAFAASASCHASFGELLQGALPDGRHFLVTLPIELRTRARFSVRDHIDELRVLPDSSWKARRLVEALLKRYQIPLRGELRLESEIPRGKGLASSTADLVAAYRAVTSCLCLPESTDVLEELLREIEPSDGVMHEGVVAYLHREVRLHERLGPVPPLVLLAIDEGGQVETLAHNVRDISHSLDERREYATLLRKLRHALARGDVGTIGAIATRSAQLNQRLLPKRWLEPMLAIATKEGAAGVVAAHSGTCLAILIDALSRNYESQIRRATARLNALGLQPRVYASLCDQVLQEIAHA